MPSFHPPCGSHQFIVSQLWIHSSLCCFEILKLDSVNISPLVDDIMLHTLSSREGWRKLQEERAYLPILMLFFLAFIVWLPADGFLANQWLPCQRWAGNSSAHTPASHGLSQYLLQWSVSLSFGVRGSSEFLLPWVHSFSLRGSSLLSTSVSYVVATFQMWQLRFKYN